MPSASRSRLLSVLFAAAALAACGGDGPTTSSSISMTLSSSTATVAQGTSATMTVTVARTNFSGDVVLTAENLPAGVTASFNPATLSGSATSSTLTLTSASTAAAASTTINVRARASGLPDQTAAVALTVPALPSFTMSVPATAAVASGATTTVNITLARTSFTGGVALAVAGLPSGMTGSFAPNPATADASALTLGAGTAAAGSYTLTVTASAAGLADRTATINLTIAAPQPGTSVAFQFCADALPTWVGYQDGTGAWKRATAGTNNSYAFSIAGKGGVAVVSPVGGNAASFGYETSIYYATATELQSIGSSNCSTAALGTKVVNGSVSGTGGSSAVIALGDRSVSTFVDGPFRLDSVQSGAHDLLAALYSNTSSGATKLIIRRGLDPVSGSTLPVLNFSAAEALTPSTFTLSLPGVASSATGFFGSTLMTGNGSQLSLGFSQTTAGAASYRGVPGTIAGDLHELTAQITETTGDRGATSFFASAGNRTLTLGPVMSTIAFSSLGAAPYPRLRAQFASQNSYSTLVYARFEQSASGTLAPTDRFVQLLATAGYFGGVPTAWDLSIPDVTAASGFVTNWMLGAGRATSSSAGAYGGDFLSSAPVDGSVFYFAQAGGSVTTVASLSPTAPTSLRLSPERRPSVAQVEARTASTLRIMHNRMLQGRR